MKKRMTAMLMALMIMVSLLPMPVMAAVSADEKTEIKSIVSEAVLDYAAKVNRADADDAAFNQYLKHGLYGKGKALTLTENSPMVAVLFNSCLLQDTLINGFTNGIVKMQNLNQRSMICSGGPGWHEYKYDCFLGGYLGGGRVSYDYYLGSVYSLGSYKGTKNENDAVMEILGGSVSTYITMIETERSESSAVYEIRLKIHDRFDFTTDYDKISDLGYNTSNDQDLVNLGFLLTFMGLDEFDWSYTTDFRVEVPIQYTHGTHNYHFTYDGSTVTLNSEGGNGFTKNPAAKIKYTYKSAEGVMTDRYYHELRDTIVLKHDCPWVMEIDQMALRDLECSPGNPGRNNVYPTLHIHNQSYVWFRFYDLGGKDGKAHNRNHYLGVKISDTFDYKSTHSYTYVLENEVRTNGGNMVYLTIYDNDLGEVVLGPEPMDDHWVMSAGESKRTLIETESDYLSGHDFLINYIGNKENGLAAATKVLDIRIWENGKDAQPDAGTYTAPTCTEDGGNVYDCPKCGLQYVTEKEAALGHSYTEYTNDGNGSCTEVGTKTRSCTRCGITETVPAEGGAVGHAFGEFVPDNNTTCTHVGTETRTCARCGLTETRNLEGSAMGHDFGAYSYDHNATCTEDGTMTAVCKSCGAKDTVSAEGSATGHSYEAAVTEPTCTEKGYTTYTCVCGDSYVGDDTDPVDHAWDAGVVTVQPTLTAPGTVKYTCTLCGETKHMSTAAVEDTGFEDVPADAYYADAVVWAKGAGVTSGLSETLFGSNMSCTRGQVVTFLWAAAGKPEPTKNENPFTDVSEADYYYKPVLWAVEQGITGGIGEGLFGPDQSCTRGQIVTFLWRAKNSPETGSSNPFTDVNEADYYFNSVLWASENAITGGIGEGLFGPNNTCTRAQVVTFLYKTYQ